MDPIEVLSQNMRIARDTIATMRSIYTQTLRGDAPITEAQAFVYNRLGIALDEICMSYAMHKYGGPVPTRGNHCSYLDMTSGIMYHTLNAVASARNMRRQTLHLAVTNGLALGERTKEPWVLAYSVDPTMWTITVTQDTAISISAGVAEDFEGVTTIPELLVALGRQ